MALTKPILYSTVAFDASDTHRFTFNVVSGDQVVKNRLTIVNQNTNIVVYDEEQTTYAYYHNVPSNILTNGEYYYAFITTYNITGDRSAPSNNIQFYCFTTPYFSFSNIPSSRIITNSSFSFDVIYNQIESEKLNSYSFNLYSVNNILVSSSGVLYTDSESQLPLTLSYNFSGFVNNTSYFIQATGITQYGTQISTNLIPIYVEYSQPTDYSIVELNNNCTDGYITIKSNLTKIDGISVPFPPEYVDNDTAVDLTSSDSYVLWDKDYTISNDFTVSLWGYNFNDNSVILEMRDSDNKNNLKIYYINEENNLYYLVLTVTNNEVLTYYIYTDLIEVNSGDKLQVWFKRINNLYEINLYNLGQ